MITCAASTFAYTNWPTFAPYGNNTYVSGTCEPGFQSTDNVNPPKRLCLASGSYQTTLLNPCIRTWTCLPSPSLLK